MRTLSKVSSRYSARTMLSMGISIVVALSLAAALATWRGSPIAGAITVLGCALAVTVFVLIRRTLRRASAQIEAILREELGAGVSRPKQNG